jgi:hypothetical protein
MLFGNRSYLFQQSSREPNRQRLYLILYPTRTLVLFYRCSVKDIL